MCKQTRAILRPCLIMLICLVTFSMSGCKQHDKGSPTNNSPYAGDWKGTFVSGPQKGTLSLNIDKDGSFTGTMYNETTKANGTADGTISDAGKMTAKYAYGTTQLSANGSVVIDPNGHLMATLRAGSTHIDLIKQ